MDKFIILAVTHGHKVLFPSIPQSVFLVRNFHCTVKLTFGRHLLSYVAHLYSLKLPLCFFTSQLHWGTPTLLHVRGNAIKILGLLFLIRAEYGCCCSLASAAEEITSGIKPSHLQQSQPWADCSQIPNNFADQANGCRVLSLIKQNEMKTFYLSSDLCQTDKM